VSGKWADTLSDSEEYDSMKEDYIADMNSTYTNANMNKWRYVEAAYGTETAEKYYVEQGVGGEFRLFEKSTGNEVNENLEYVGDDYKGIKTADIQDKAFAAHVANGPTEDFK
jgi:hypothetical protein